MTDMSKYLNLDDYDTIVPKHVRAGDTIMRVYEQEYDLICRRFTVVEIDGEWLVGTHSRRMHRSVPKGGTLYLIDRPKPKLPIEPGSVIIATEVRGIKGEWPMILDHDASWFAERRILGYQRHDPEHITAWRPAEIREVEA